MTGRRMMFRTAMLLTIAVAATGKAQDSQSESRRQYVEGVRRDCEEKKLWSRCHELGKFYFDGWVVAESETRARELFEGACDGGSLPACNDLGSMYFSGTGGVTRNLTRAVELYRRACDGPNPSGCGNLGMAYAHGLGVPTNADAAGDLFRRACASADGVGCQSLRAKTSPGLRTPLRDPAVAVEHSLRSCESGATDACLGLGQDYSLGRGVPLSHSRTETLFRLACDAGNMEGCYHLPDERERACNSGYLPACTLLVQSEMPGFELSFRGLSLLKKTCEGGDAEGCGALANWRRTGSRVNFAPSIFAPKVDFSLDELVRRSCDGGLGSGCYELGRNYETGFGVKKNDKRAVTFFQRACDLGNSKACKRMLDSSLVKP